MLPRLRRSHIAGMAFVAAARLANDNARSPLASEGVRQVRSATICSAALALALSARPPVLPTLVRLFRSLEVKHRDE